MSNIIPIPPFDIKQYEKGEYISQGSFGKVYKTYKKGTNEEYAIKIINNLKAVSEITVMSIYAMDSIVKFYGYTEKDFDNFDSSCILMEYYPNGNVTNQIKLESENKKSPGWTNTAKMKVIYGSARALEFLHYYKVLHRDFGPNNILLDEKFLPYVSDFGLSQENFESINRQTNTKGTVLFTAPEVHRENVYHRKSEVYSFGMTMYAIIAGKFPFDHIKSPFQLTNTIINGTRPQFDFQIPHKMKNLIISCWDDNTEKRPTFRQIIDLFESGVCLDDVDMKSYNEYIHQDFHYSKDPPKYRKNLPPAVPISYPLPPTQRKRIEKLPKVNSKLSKFNSIPHKRKPLEEGMDLLTKTINRTNYHSASVSQEGGDDTLLLTTTMSMNGEDDIFTKSVQGNSSLNFGQVLSESQTNSLLFRSVQSIARENVKDESIQVLEEADKNGNLDAKYQLGLIYYNGLNGVHINKRQAYGYFKDGAKKGHIRSLFMAGFCYYAGVGTNKNPKNAEICFRKAAHEQHPESNFFLGIMYIEGNGVKQDANKGIDYIKKYGEITNNTTIDAVVEETMGNYKRAISIYKKNIDNDPTVKRKIGYCYYRLNEYSQALIYYKQAIAVNDSLDESYFYAGLCCFMLGSKETFGFFSKALELNYEQAIPFVGLCYDTGKYGVKQNIPKSYDYFKRSADSGNRIGKMFLANYYQQHEQNYGLAIPLFEETIDIDSNNYFKIGFCAFFLELFEKAVKYLQISIDKKINIELSSLIMGVIHANPQANMDKNKAASYFKVASDGGIDLASLLVGICYETGDGIEQDYQKALDSYVNVKSQTIHFRRGYCLDHLGRHDEAIKEFKLSIEDNDSVEVATFNIGRLYLTKKDDPQQALQYFERVEDMAAMEIIMCHLELLQFEQAYQLCQKAAEEQIDKASELLVLLTAFLED